jgi:uncharacterized protein
VTAPEAEIRVRVKPRAARSAIVGFQDGVLEVRLASPPVEGRANEELCRLLARRLRVGRRAVEVVRGAHARQKVVRITGLDEPALRRAFHDLL